MPEPPWKVFAGNALERLKWCYRNKKYTIRNRTEYLELMEKHGLTIEDQKCMICNLTIEDFVEHGADDRNPMIDVWFFKPHYQGIIMYVKFEILDRGGDYALVISAHPDIPQHRL